MKVSASPLLIAFHFALASGTFAQSFGQSVGFENVVGPDGGPLTAMAAYGDTLLVAPEVHPGVAGPYYSWDGGKTWGISKVTQGWGGITTYLKLEDRLFAASYNKGLLFS